MRGALPVHPGVRRFCRTFLAGVYRPPASLDSSCGFAACPSPNSETPMAPRELTHDQVADELIAPFVAAPDRPRPQRLDEGTVSAWAEAYAATARALADVAREDGDEEEARREEEKAGLYETLTLVDVQRAAARRAGNRERMAHTHPSLRRRIARIAVRPRSGTMRFSPRTRTVKRAPRTRRRITRSRARSPGRKHEPDEPAPPLGGYQSRALR